MTMDTSPKNLSLAPPSPQLFSVCRCCENLEANASKEAWTKSLDEERLCKIFKSTSWGSVVHPEVVAIWLDFFWKGRLFLGRNHVHQQVHDTSLFWGGGSAVGVPIVDMLAICFLSVDSPRKMEIHPRQTLLKRCILHRVRSRYDWNSPTRCHTKTWYVRFWPKHVNLMILPSKMTALPGEIGRANVVFGCKWDQFRSQTSPLKWDVDTVYQRLHLRKTTHFPWFHDWSYAQINAANTHDLEKALLTLQVVLQGCLGVIDGRVPQQVMEWLHLRIEIGWLKQTCRRLWENIPLYIYSILIIYYVVYLVVHMGYEQRRETARKQQDGFTKKRPSTGTETSETLLTS